MMTTKFPMRIGFSASEPMADAIERIADANEMTVSAVMRHAMQLYLAHMAAMNQPARPVANGHGEQAVL